MDNDKKLEVLLIYRSNEGKEIMLYDIDNTVDVMDEIHYMPSGFWNCSGGLSICINGYCTIFNSCSFYNLVKVTNFLINSLYLVKGLKSERFDTVDFNVDGLKINTLNNEQLILKEIND